MADDGESVGGGDLDTDAETNLDASLKLLRDYLSDRSDSLPRNLVDAGKIML